MLSLAVKRRAAAIVLKVEEEVIVGVIMMMMVSLEQVRGLEFTVARGREPATTGNALQTREISTITKIIFCKCKVLLMFFISNLLSPVNDISPLVPGCTLKYVFCFDFAVLHDC